MLIGPCGLDLQHFDHKSSKANACLGLIENVSEVWSLMENKLENLLDYSIPPPPTP